MTEKKRPLILLCNDDGFFAAGIRALHAALKPIAEVVIVAPDKDQSGVSHKLTLNRTLRIRDVAEGVYAVNGSPVDCIHLALYALMTSRKPDLVMSGINHGLNLGEDTAYSGTVAAAYEAFVHGIPAIAFSTGKDETGYDFENAGQFAARLAKAALDGELLLKDAVWNVNVPPGQVKGVKVVRLDRRSFKSSMVKRLDPRGEPYYWHGPYYPEFERDHGADFSAYHDGYVAMTPLKVEMTDFSLLEKVAGGKQAFFEDLEEWTP